MIINYIYNFYFYNLDNIACPLASATGDIVTLILLAGCATLLQSHMGNLLLYNSK